MKPFCSSQIVFTNGSQRSGSCHHDIRHPWPLARRHDSICGSAASRGRALGLYELECRRLQEGTISGLVEYLCLATAAGAERLLSLPLALERPPCQQFKKTKKTGSSRNQVLLKKKKNGPVKIKKKKPTSWSLAKTHPRPHPHPHQNAPTPTPTPTHPPTHSPTDTHRRPHPQRVFCFLFLFFKKKKTNQSFRVCKVLTVRPKARNKQIFFVCVSAACVGVGVCGCVCVSGCRCMCGCLVVGIGVVCGRMGARVCVGVDGASFCE